MNASGEPDMIPVTVRDSVKSVQGLKIRSDKSYDEMFSVKRVNSTTSWSKDTEEYYKKKFKYSLSRGDGKMDLEAFRKSLGLLGVGKGNEGLARLLFEAIAPENESLITCKEYLHALRTMIEGTPEDKIRFGFTLLDKNKSNKVTEEDIQNVLQILYRSYSSLLGYTYGPGREHRHIGIKDVAEVVKRFDTDKNGDIQISEWILGIQKHQDIFSSLAHIINPETALARWNDCKRYATLLEDTLLRERKALRSSVERTSNGDDERKASTLPRRKPPPPSLPPPLPDGTKRRSPPTRSNTVSHFSRRRTNSSTSTSFINETLETMKRLTSALEAMRREMDYLQPVSALPQTLRERRRSLSLMKLVAMEAAAAAAKEETAPVVARDESDDSTATKTVDTETSSADARTKKSESRSLLTTRIAASTKGSVVAFGSEYWDTTLGIMQGIHMSAVRAAGEGNRPLSRHDFNVRDKYTLKPESVDPEFKRTRSTSDIKFYDYAPRAFHFLRSVWGISPRDYVTSCGPGKILSNLIIGSLTAISRMRSEGKSGDFFYTTGDSRYMMKTIAKLEFQTFRDMLPEYVEHMTVRNLDASPPTPGLDSLICKFAGLHKMKIQNGNKVQKLYFVVMLNCNPPDDVVEVHRRLDLKGSYAGRTAIKKSKDMRSLKKLPLNVRFDTILKDNDFDSLVHSIGSIRLGSERKLMLTETMRADVKFLQRHEIMDYSLIVSCHFKVGQYSDLSRRPSQDFNDPKWQLREAFQAPVSLKRNDIEAGTVNKPYLCNIDLQKDMCEVRNELEMQSSFVDLAAKMDHSKKPAVARTHGMLQKRNDNFSLMQGRWSARYFELHNMFLYYWKSRKERDRGKDTWTGAWNLLRVDTVTLDEDEKTLTLAFDDIVKDAGCEVTRKVMKHNDVWILREWETAIRDRLHYFRSGELEAFYVRQQKSKMRKTLSRDKAVTMQDRNTAGSTKFDSPVSKGAASRKSEEMVSRSAKKLHDDHEHWGITAEDDSAVYYIGIVDCFTKFDTTRGISYFFEGSNKSNVPPDMYARRFFNVNKTRFS